MYIYLYVLVHVWISRYIPIYIVYVCLYKWRQDSRSSTRHIRKTLSFWTFAWPSLLLLLCDLLFLLLLLYCFVMLSSAHSLLQFCFVTLFGFQNKCEYCAFSITKLTFESISRYIELFVSVRLPACLSVCVSLSACVCALACMCMCVHACLAVSVRWPTGRAM